MKRASYSDLNDPSILVGEGDKGEKGIEGEEKAPFSPPLQISHPPKCFAQTIKNHIFSYGLAYIPLLGSHWETSSNIAMCPAPNTLLYAHSPNNIRRYTKHPTVIRP